MTKPRFKDFFYQVDNLNMSKTRARLNKKSHKNRYGAVESEPVTEKSPKEEERESVVKKIDLARQLFQSLINRPDLTRKEIIQHMVDRIGITDSTAVSYYERLAKEAGLTNKEDKNVDLGLGVDMGGGKPIDMPSGRNSTPQNQRFMQRSQMDDENVYDTTERDGIIRTVKNAHLVYKRQTENGSFEELWVYNVTKGIRDEMTIRRDILAGTDIPPLKTESPDGTQHYTLTTMGNAQLLHITGLPN